MLGNIKFIGELGRLDLLNEAILHKCIRSLLEKHKSQTYADMSDDLECFCKMMPSVGQKLDQNEAKKLMDQYFERLEKLKSMGGKDALPMRIKFMIQDCIDLRKNSWEPRKIELEQAPRKVTELRPGPRPSEPAASPSAPTLNPFLNKMYQHINSRPNMTLLNAINSLGKKNNHVTIKSAYSSFNYQDESDDLSSTPSSCSSQTDLNKNGKEETKTNFVPLSLAPRPSHRLVQAEKTRSNSSSSMSALSSSSSVAPSVSPPIQIEIQKSTFFDNHTAKSFSELNRLIPNLSVNEADVFSKQVDLSLDSYLESSRLDLEAMKKFSNEKLTDFVRVVIGLSLSKRSDADRSKVSQMIAEMESVLGMSGLFKSSLKKVLDNLTKLEQEHHCVKSNVGLYISRAVIDRLVEIRFLADLMKNGAYYPLFFIVMQQLVRLKVESGLSLDEGQCWLKELIEREKVSLIDMLPNNADKNRSRLAQVLSDRELDFLRPMLRYEETMFAKMSADGVPSAQLIEWIDQNLSEHLIASNEFIRSLTNCVVRNAVEKSILSTDLNQLGKQKEFIQKYKTLINNYTGDIKEKQVQVLQAIQNYTESNGFPQYFLKNLFNQFLELNIIDNETFNLFKQ